MSLSLLLLAILPVGPIQGSDDDPNLERRWFSRVFGAGRVKTLLNGTITRVASHQPGFTRGERPGLALLVTKKASPNWSERFREAFLDVRNHEWQVRRQGRFQVDASVRFETPFDRCDIGFSFSTGEVVLWSDIEGRSVEQSIQPCYQLFQRIIAEILPGIGHRFKVGNLPDIDTRYSPPARSSILELRVKGLAGQLPSEWIQTLTAPDNVQAQLLKGEFKRTPFGRQVAPSKEWIRSFSRVIQNRDNFAWGGGSNCGFRPDIRLEFTRKLQTVLVEFCFSCDAARLTEVGASSGAKRISCHPGRPEFLTLAREVFPKDKALADLPLMRN